MRRFVVAIAIVLAFAAVVAPTASAATTCTGTLAVGTFGNVTVPMNATCTLQPGTTINGNIQVQQGATLLANGIHVTGNIQAVSARGIRIQHSTIDGSVQIFGLTGVP